MSGRFLTRAGLTLFTLGSFFQGGEAQLGHVVKAQKISATSGGLTATLDEMDQFGRSIVNLGDLDGDGITDLLVGAHTDDDGGIDQGAVYVLFMRANSFVKSWQKISDLAGNFAGRLDPGDQFGRAAANLGDLDGDGVIDIAVSANYDDDGGANKGAIYILFLNSDGTVKSSQKISELSGGLPVTLRIHDEFGRSITNLGDLDGDGVIDLLVGTPEDDEGGTNTGALHVLFLNTTGTVKSYRRISKFTDGLALKPGDWFGFCSASLGDFDGDGVNDVVVGAVLDDDGGTNQGSIWLLMLNADGSVKSAHEIDELEGGFTAQLDDIDQFGTSVANIGDLDGDGVTDIVVGAVKDDDGGTPGDPDSDVGALYVLFLKSDKTVKSWVKISDESGDLPYSLDKWDWFGSAAARLGGSPGDGLWNMAVGCRNDDDSGPNRGAIYLLQLNDGTAPVADFVADATLGVAPLTVQFTDTSAGNTTSWVWNFSDGPQSTERHPSKTFETPGLYDITLVARGPTGVDTLVRAEHIEVVVGPWAAFVASARVGDCPLAVQFEDRSLGEVTSWSWDFGDGTSSNDPSPLHVYDCGTYDVTLTVSGPSGTHTRGEAAYVVAAIQPPVADFALAPAAGVAPLDVQFADLSSGAITAWSWDFGDGEVASARAPLHTFALPGSYSVALTVTGPGGSDTKLLTGAVDASVPPPVADFDGGPTAGIEPLSVGFSDLSSGAITSWSWDFGDGGSSSEASPIYVFETPGVYSVALTTSGPGGLDTRLRTDFVTVLAAPPGADFSAAPLAGEAPLLVQFHDDSALVVTSWSWDFGDGSGSSEQHPAHLYTLPGEYSVSLTVRGPGGTDSELRSALIHVAPSATTADFSAAPRSGVAPLAVDFLDVSSANVTSWSWDFGDGSGAQERNPRHTYTLPGLYSVRLAVTSPTGSSHLERTGWVEVFVPAPVAAFDLSPSTGVAPFTAVFVERSSGAIDEWIWDFGDGSSSRKRAPTHVYGSPGLYSVTLTVIGPGGSDSLTRSNGVEVLAAPPVAGLTAAPTSGIAPLAVQFGDLSTGAITGWSWDFGDGAGSALASPQHTYTTPGTYSVVLTVRGPGGTDTESRADLVSVQHAPPVADFSATPRDGFAPLAVTFGDLSSGAIDTWSWTFGDGSSSSVPSPTHVFLTPGSYPVVLRVAGPGGESSRQRTIVARAAPLFADGSFELQTSGLEPVSPWRVFRGNNTRIRPAAGEPLFAADGLLLCDLGAEGSANALPPSNPGGAGTPAFGLAGLEQSFLFPMDAPHLFFEAAFLRNGPARSTSTNDFMSVDIGDGTTIWNLWFADSFADFPLVSAVHALPMTAPERVHVDLAALFPNADASTVLTLRFGVGNHGNGAAPSRGLIDGFRFEPAASATFRNGRGLNPALYVASPAVIGGQFTVTIDGGQRPAAGFARVLGRQNPLAGTPLLGGELLIGGKPLFTLALPLRGTSASLTLPMPADPSLVGLRAATQAVLFGGGLTLSNAFDLRLGY